MYPDLRLLRMTEGIRLPILLPALLGLMAVGAAIPRLAVSGVVIAQVIQATN